MPFPYSSKGIENDMPAAGKYPPVPIGTYEFHIKDIKEKLTKNGDPMVSATLEIINDRDYAERLMWLNVTFPKPDPATGKPPQWAGIGIHFLKTIDEPFDGDFIVTPEAWIGKTFKAKTKMGKDQNGNPRAEIAFVIGKDEVAAEEPLPF